MSSEKQKGEIQMQSFIRGVLYIYWNQGNPLLEVGARSPLMSATCNCSKLCQFKSEFEINLWAMVRGGGDSTVDWSVLFDHGIGTGLDFVRIMRASSGRVRYWVGKL